MVKDRRLWDSKVCRARDWLAGVSVKLMEAGTGWIVVTGMKGDTEEASFVRVGGKSYKSRGDIEERG